MVAPKKARLGRGLDELIAGGIPGAGPDKASDPLPSPELFREIDITLVEPSPHQPRREMDEALIAELAESIRQEGLLQPVVVREDKGRFQLVAGERRWRACQKLGQKKILARVVHVGESSAAAIALIENLQRENLNPVDESLGFASLMHDFDLTQDAVAQRVGKPRSSIANSLRLLALGKEIQGFISKGILSVGHAKVLLGLEKDEERTLLARRIVERGLSVRDTERLVQGMKRTRSQDPAKTRAAAEDAALKDIQKRLQSHLGTSVELKHAAKHGRIVIDYYGSDDLERIIDKLCS
ncbi:MAG TPA: ParB/RepB/Spo0J family partition protein [Opitutales bacterium]|mgnify:CR=1 FL=1|nr:ParB/RepB/Spo0J family partition protein [Opitutales bacterium]